MDERERLSRILHDDIGQILTAVGVQLELLRLDTRETAPELAARLSEAQKLLEQAMERIRALSRELRAGVQ